MQELNAKDLERMFFNQLGKCNLTGVELGPDTLTADHIQPMEDGGSNTADNVQIVHDIINTMKGSLSNDQFIEWCCRVADYSRMSEDERFDIE